MEKTQYGQYHFVILSDSFRSLKTNKVSNNKRKLNWMNYPLKKHPLNITCSLSLYEQVNGVKAHRIQGPDVTLSNPFPSAGVLALMFYRGIIRHVKASYCFETLGKQFFNDSAESKSPLWFPGIREQDGGTGFPSLCMVWSECFIFTENTLA